MRYAVVGSRKFRDLPMVREFVCGLSSGDLVISGGAMGVDTVAIRAAKDRAVPWVEYLPNYARDGDAAPLIRNRKIVDECDRVMAFWDGHSPGTAYTVEYARRRGVPVDVIRERDPKAPQFITAPAQADLFS